MNKAEVGHLKANLSATHDQTRLAYRTDAQDFPRQSIFIGTCNPDAPYLRTATASGPRPTAREADGESIRLEPGLYPIATQEQEARQSADPFVEELDANLGDAVGWLLRRDAFLLLGIPAKDQTPALTTRVAGALKANGWQRKQKRFGGQKVYVYRRGDADEIEQPVDIRVDPITKKVSVHITRSM